MLNKKYSFKDFCGKSLIKEDPKEFTGIIKGSCFYHECPEDRDEPLVDVFPDGIECTFERCNLDNVVIPPKCTVMECCTNKRVKVQNDREDWVLHPDNKPLEPIAKKRFIKLGISTDAKDIPTEKLDESIVMKTEVIVKAAEEKVIADAIVAAKEALLVKELPIVEVSK